MLARRLGQAAVATARRRVRSGGLPSSTSKTMAAAVSRSRRRPFLTPSPFISSVREMSFNYPAPRALGEIVDLEKLEGEDGDSIKRIWEEYHRGQKWTVAAQISPEQHSSFKERSAKGQYFIFPIGRVGKDPGADEEGEGSDGGDKEAAATPDGTGSGFMVLLSQAQDGKHVLLTWLEEFRLDPSKAPSYMTVTFYPELEESKGVVLVRGDVTEGLLTRLEGEFLLHQLLHAYIEGDVSLSPSPSPSPSSSSQLWDEVDAFNNRPAEFDFEGYCVRALEAQKDWTTARVQQAMSEGST